MSELLDVEYDPNMDHIGTEPIPESDNVTNTSFTLGVAPWNKGKSGYHCNTRRKAYQYTEESYEKMRQGAKKAAALRWAAYRANLPS